MKKTKYGAEILPGNISINRVTGGGEAEIWISLEEETSGIQFARFKMTLENFAKVITSQSCIEGTLELIGLDKLGWKAENKTEIISAPSGMSDKGKKEAEQAVKTLEVDGWRARKGDVTNHHCWKGNTVSVVFFRHVKPD